MLYSCKKSKKRLNGLKK